MATTTKGTKGTKGAGRVVVPPKRTPVAEGLGEVTGAIAREACQLAARALKVPPGVAEFACGHVAAQLDAVVTGGEGWPVALERLRSLAEAAKDAAGAAVHAVGRAVGEVVPAAGAAVEDVADAIAGEVHCDVCGDKPAHERKGGGAFCVEHMHGADVAAGKYSADAAAAFWRNEARRGR